CARNGRAVAFGTDAFDFW
nr:immunoglobulin heavy chain junction region [Macaca mulatta]MOX94881.1 immunoglobulin heavy chain junction region [Macaca mulatta]MOX94966.1 immunoglobulin heavy chain junction region [Macaca mulatta]MOX95146.1 immunoglobulin heavy chain junction region [Macaca mulatta]MOX97075.1 immunoglobulin heavy chain junction region [Macaca mulatta]